MGVSGSGKTTVGRLVAQRLGAAFLDADDFHPAANVAKMRAGTPLTDEDRAGWLDRLRAEIERARAGKRTLVLACSALRESYRERLRGADTDVVFAHLEGDRELIAARLAARSGHYMPASLLESQFAALEPPTDAINVPLELQPEAAATVLLEQLARRTVREPRP